MPRPGPRPYECVRRAWHSERHQAIKGSIIQQIFRVVTEAHSSATRKNREWKEKLPIVVFRAEEIMYSKANSEAEYTNLETLWERVNDAIDTIIRKDESTETGDLLPPCVEAALNLGCAPVRASRSQRHSNPRSYLTPRAQDPPPPPPTLSPNKPNNERASNQPSYAEPKVAPSSYPSLYENNRANNIPSSGSVYPLYYGNHHYVAEKSHVGPRVPENPSHETILVGTPVGSSNLLCHDKAPNCVNYAEPRESSGKKCDLSLRLGPSSEWYESTERSPGDAGSSHSHSQEFCFFPRKSCHHQSEFK